MARSLLIIGLAALMFVRSPEAQETKPPDDMEFIEFLGTFEKEVDPLMLGSMSNLKKVPQKSPQKGSSHEKKDTKQEDDRDE